MGRKKFTSFVIPELEIINAGSEGKSIGRYNDKVVMVDFAVPGDIADVKVISNKKSFYTAQIQKISKASPDRIETFCTHFGICGGCKWQHMSYAAQLKFKNQQVVDAFERIGKFPFAPFEPIAGSERTTYYRNKCEFSFTDRKWLTNVDQLHQLTDDERKGLGYHIPGRFDKVFDVEHCYLQHPTANEIRNAIRDYAIKHNMPFFNAYTQEGKLRNLMLRNNEAGDWMVVLSAKGEYDESLQGLLEFIKDSFPQVTSLMYVINNKRNDTLYDLDIQLYAGVPYLIEELEGLKFKIGPKSFFQTNAMQTQQLYQIARDFAGLTGNEVVYDLYTGVGTIAMFISAHAKQVIGVEYVEAAIVDAKENASLNKITNTLFFAGDMKDVLNPSFINQHGKPDVIITDPPRAGMHEQVIATLLQIEAPKIVYVSCNPATQARDLGLLNVKYNITRVKPVDMFPHTHHVENVALLTLK